MTCVKRVDLNEPEGLCGKGEVNLFNIGKGRKFTSEDQLEKFLIGVNWG